MSTRSAARERSPRRGLCAAVLALEAITLALSTPVMIKLLDVQVGTALTLGLGLAAVCLVAAALLGREWGYWLGWVVQVWAIALGFVVLEMFALGVIFAVIWWVAYWLGRKIERERAAAYDAYDKGSPAGS